MKVLVLTCLVLLGCTIRVVQETRMDTVAVADTVREAVIIGTKKDSVVAWEEWVQGIKDTLWVDACNQILMVISSSRVVIEKGWSGDFVSYVCLEVLTHRRHLLLYGKEETDYDEETLFFVWRRDPVNGLWKRRHK